MKEPAKKKQKPARAPGPMAREPGRIITLAVDEGLLAQVNDIAIEERRTRTQQINIFISRGIREWQREKYEREREQREREQGGAA